MTRNDLIKTKLPDTPGVYFFLGVKKEMLYIGKATTLDSRVKSYFGSDIAEKRSLLISNMVEEAVSIECTPTDSVLEAVILETNLIRTHKPKYNTRSKDDKSYNHLVITEEEFPRVLVVRGKDVTEKFTPDEIRAEFGPFPSGQLLKDALGVVRRIFKFYDTKKPLGQETSTVGRGRINFNKQIGLYPSTDNKEEYLRTINQLQLLFSGDKEKLIENLNKEMFQFAKKEEFEQADIMKRRIFSLKHIQDISLLKDDSRIYRDEKRIRIEGYDIAHLQGKDMVGVMTVLEGGEPARSEYRKFKIKTFDNANDPGALREVLSRRLKHTEWPTPQVIVVDGNSVQKNAAEKELKKMNLIIPVIAVVKDDKHKPTRLIGMKDIIKQHKVAILQVNAEAHRFAVAYHREKRAKGFISN